MDSPSIEELERLYSSLGPQERENLLEELLVARSKSVDAMVSVLDVWLFEYGVRDFIRNLSEEEL